MPRSREAQAAARAERYAEYVKLCQLNNVPQQSDRWWTHRRELLNLPEPARRLTMQELRDWWTERFTPREIYEMASAFYA